MQFQYNCFPLRAVALWLALFLVLPTASYGQSESGATPQVPDPAKLIEALKSKATRGASQPTAAGVAEAEKRQKLIESLRAKATRGLSVSDRRQLAEVTSDKPAVDLEINFDFNSSEITEKISPLVMALGRSLGSPELKGEKFMVAGHTDAKGRASYNQALSERRARAVKDFLIANFALTDEQLMAVGYGSERLKNAKAPYADENRRVQVINISPAVAMKP